jgi:hypothetical protein
MGVICGNEAVQILITAKTVSKEITPVAVDTFILLVLLQTTLNQTVIVSLLIASLTLITS